MTAFPDDDSQTETPTRIVGSRESNARMGLFRRCSVVWGDQRQDFGQRKVMQHSAREIKK